MYNIKPQQYFTDIFRFLKNNDNRISPRKTFYYIIAIFSILIIGQIIANNSEPYKSDHIENEKFINAEINRQTIIDTFSLPMKQSCFKSYFAIKLKDGSIYRLNVANSDIEDKITRNAIIEKKANDKIFEIINNNIRYKIEISELTNFRERLFVFFASIFLSVIVIPLWIKKNELEKEY